MELRSFLLFLLRISLAIFILMLFAFRRNVQLLESDRLSTSIKTTTSGSFCFAEKTKSQIGVKISIINLCNWI